MLCVYFERLCQQDSEVSGNNNDIYCQCVHKREDFDNGFSRWANRSDAYQLAYDHQQYSFRHHTSQLISVSHARGR
jgi:hypothetical protein